MTFLGIPRSRPAVDVLTVSVHVSGGSPVVRVEPDYPDVRESLELARAAGSPLWVVDLPPLPHGPAGVALECGPASPPGMEM